MPHSLHKCSCFLFRRRSPYLNPIMQQQQTADHNDDDDDNAGGGGGRTIFCAFWADMSCTQIVLVAAAVMQPLFMLIHAVKKCGEYRGTCTFLRCPSGGFLWFIFGETNCQMVSLNEHFCPFPDSVKTA